MLVGALGCYGAKLAGLSVPERVLEDVRVQRVAALLPLSLLAALTAVQAFADGRHLELDARAGGLLFAAGAVLLRAPFLVVVFGAAATAAALRALT
nr:AzlD domain-containing protein [Motilibacter peucedani]